MKVPLLAEIPLDPKTREMGDSGTPIATLNDGNAQVAIFSKLARDDHRKGGGDEAAGSPDDYDRRLVGARSTCSLEPVLHSVNGRIGFTTLSRSRQLPRR